MRRIASFYLLFFCFAFKAYPQTYPFNIYNNSGGSLPIYKDQGSTSAGESLPSGSQLATSGIMFNTSTGVGYYEVNTPDYIGCTNGTCTNRYWIEAGNSYMKPYCSGTYVKIANLSPGPLNIRPSAGSTSYIHDNATGSYVPYAHNGETYAVESTTVVGSVRWYQIYITDKWSQTTGWIDGGYTTSGGKSGSSPISSSTNAFAVPTYVSCANVKSSAADISWYSNPIAEKYNIFANSSTFPISTPSSTTPTTTLSGLSPSTKYSIQVEAMNSNGCSSSPSATISFTTPSTTCNYTLTPGSIQSASSSGTSSSFSISTSSSCSWTATSAYSWITITSGSSGTSSGTCYYTVSGNTSGLSRSGNIVIRDGLGNQQATFEIDQIAPPIANFSSNHKNITPGTQVTFYDQSSNTPASWLWIVNGASPNSSTLPNPTFTFNTTGCYTVILKASNSAGTGSIQKSCYITVSKYGTNKLLPTANNAIRDGSNQCQLAEPIQIGTATYKYKHADFQIPVIAGEIDFTRYYNSLNHNNNSSIGFGWSYSYSYAVKNLIDTAWEIYYPDGHIGTYIPINNGGGISYALYGGMFDSLNRNPLSKEYTLITKYKVKYQFDSSGRLYQITDLNGNVTSLLYTANNLESVQGPGGRKLTFAYNSNGYLKSVSEPSGNAYNYNYDANGNLISAQDPNGNITKYSYDTYHQFVSLTNALGITILANTYDGNNRVISQKDAYGYATSIAYGSSYIGNATIAFPDSSSNIITTDSAYRMTKTIDGLGFVKTQAYDKASNPVLIANENNQVEQDQFDTFGNLTLSILPGNRSYSLSYNSFNKPTSVTDPLSNTTYYSYDNYGNLSSINYPDNSTRQFTYYSNGLLNSKIDGNGYSTYYYYDSYGDIVKIITPTGVKNFTYDSDGKLVSYADENGHTTKIGYDRYTNITSITDALNQTQYFSYDSANQLIYIIDKRKLVTKFAYDNKGRLISKTNAMSGLISYTYDAMDNLVSKKDENGNLTTYKYDKKGRLISKTNALGVTELKYDGVGNLLSSTDPLNLITTYKYNSSNNLDSIIDPLSHISGLVSNGLNSITASTDPLSNLLQYFYDPMRRLKTVVDPYNKSTSYSYDKNGNMITIADANKHTQNMQYDSSNRLLKYQDASGFSYSFAYDAIGNIVSVNTPTGLITKSYDSLDRPVKVVNSSGDTYYFTYDADNNIASMSNSAGTSTSTYDSLNRMSSYLNPFSKKVSYTYDKAGNIRSISYPGSKTVTYTYDSANNLKTVKDWLGKTFAYNYDSSGRLKQIKYPNGIHCDYIYDIAGSLTSKQTVLPSGKIIQGSTFTLDADGNRVGEQRKNMVPANLIPNSYSYSYANNDALVSDGQNTYSNDHSGNRISKKSSKDSTNYSFSTDNLLTGVNIDGTQTIYIYDPMGRRISKKVGNNATQYVLDISRQISKVLQTTDSKGNIEANYIYGLGLLESIDANDNAEFYHFDAQHNTTAITDKNDTILSTYTYDPFGVLLNQSGKITQPFTFLGEFGVEQETTSLYYIRARYFDASNGRFMSKDPLIGNGFNSQSINKYLYSLNNPLRRYDYSGYSGWLDKIGNWVDKAGVGVDALLETPIGQNIVSSGQSLLNNAGIDANLEKSLRVTSNTLTIAAGAISDAQMIYNLYNVEFGKESQNDFLVNTFEIVAPWLALGTAIAVGITATPVFFYIGVATVSIELLKDPLSQYLYDTYYDPNLIPGGIIKPQKRCGN